MRLSEVLKDNTTQKEIQAAIVKHKVPVGKAEVLELCGSKYNPTPELCELILRHGDEAQRQEITGFMIGLIVEYKSLSMTKEAHQAATILLDHFAEMEEKALAEAEKAVAAATAAPGKGK